MLHTLQKVILFLSICFVLQCKYLQIHKSKHIYWRCKMKIWSLVFWEIEFMIKTRTISVDVGRKLIFLWIMSIFLIPLTDICSCFNRLLIIWHYWILKSYSFIKWQKTRSKRWCKHKILQLNGCLVFSKLIWSLLKELLNTYQGFIIIIISLSGFLMLRGMSCNVSMRSWFLNTCCRSYCEQFINKYWSCNV